MKTAPMKDPNTIVILPYRRSWIWQFRCEALMLRFALGKHAKAIRHIGSTSVPGLAAKPVIDILVGIRTLQEAPLLVPRLAHLGYRYRPEYEVDLPERRYFDKKRRGHHRVHLHMVEMDGAFFRRHIAFRDYLCAHADAAAEYAALKMNLAEKYGADREGYSNAKTEFIQRIERQALS